jgi:hypothetical protein
MSLHDYGIQIDTRGFIKAHIDGNSGHTFSTIKRSKDFLQ